MNRIMVFLRRHLLLIASLMMGVICIGLYLFLVRPVMVDSKKTSREIKDKMAILKRYRKNPPSPEMVNRFSREKELLERQYEDVTKELAFLPKRSLPEKIGLLHLYFEEQLEKAEDDLDRLEKKTGIAVPARLGFEMEKPQNEDELAILLSQVAAVKELITIAIGAGVNQVSSINPLPLTEDRFIKVSGKPLLEELDMELSLRADLPALTNLLYQLSTCPHFWTSEKLELKSVSPSPRGEVPPPGRQPRRGRRGREVVTGEPVAGGGERRYAQKRTVTELEARILISTRMLLDQLESPISMGLEEK